MDTLWDKPELPPHRMHANSLAAYREEVRGFVGRARAILVDMLDHGPGTDRDIRDRMGFTDMNSVRPRITELIETGMLLETGQRKCPVTGKMVRVVGAPIKAEGEA